MVGAGGTVVSNYGTIFMYYPSISDHISNAMTSNLEFVSIAFEDIPWESVLRENTSPALAFLDQFWAVLIYRIGFLSSEK